MNLDLEMNLDLNTWIYKYYIDPIIYDTGYNPINTVTWALLLGVFILGLIWIFRRLDIKMNERLLLYTMPYVLAGSSLRVIEDAELVKPPASYLLITPLIYFLVFLVTASMLILCTKYAGRKSLQIYACFGLIWTFINLVALSTVGIHRPIVPVAVLFMGSVLTALIFLIRRGIPWLNFLNNRYNLAILYSHMLDASSTYIGVDWFGYYEKHVVPTFLIDLTGTAAIMYPLKLMVLLPVLSIIDQSIEDPSLRNLAKLTLIILGLAPAIRNTLRLTLGI
jgi:uncharacterized membrane protein